MLFEINRVLAMGFYQQRRVLNFAEAIVIELLYIHVCFEKITRYSVNAE